VTLNEEMIGQIYNLVQDKLPKCLTNQELKRKKEGGC
jgi:hypothetical protein